ncbi:SDR family oxidoreductase [Candidatus Thorarchaeota archaeon]|nr:MAG: SDR family oxidoreductase [Candidatus Thorarchaeota archaeon]
MTFENKVAIVTGAAQGIGLGIARELAKRGARVALSDISDEVVVRAKELSDEGYDVMSVVGDVSDTGQVQDMVDDVSGRWDRIDILVNNAGIYPYKALDDMERPDWDRVININLTGTYNFTKAVLPHMQKHGGSIINIASIAGTTVGYEMLAHYSASKAGVLGFTKAAALELAKHKIRVNAIAPGAIQTPTVEKVMDEATRKQTIESIPWKRMGTPEDIGKATAFLASDDSEYITGQLLIVDGGLTDQ